MQGSHFYPSRKFPDFFPLTALISPFSSASGNLALFQAKPFHYYQCKRSASSQSANLLRPTAFWAFVKRPTVFRVDCMFSYLMPIPFQSSYLKIEVIFINRTWNFWFKTSMPSTWLKSSSTEYSWMICKRSKIWNNSHQFFMYQKNNNFTHSDY